MIESLVFNLVRKNRVRALRGRGVPFATGFSELKDSEGPGHPDTVVD